MEEADMGDKRPVWMRIGAALMLVFGLSGAPALATLMVGPDMAGIPSETKKVPLAEADAVADGTSGKLTEIEAGGMIAASVLFTLMLWRGVRPTRTKD